MKNPLSFISRRHFLKSAGALAACGLAGGLVPLPAFAGQGLGRPLQGLLPVAIYLQQGGLLHGQGQGGQQALV